MRRCDRRNRPYVVPSKIFGMSSVVLCVKVYQLRPLSKNCKLLYKKNVDYLTLWRLITSWKAWPRTVNFVWKWEVLTYPINAGFICLGFKYIFVNIFNRNLSYNLWNFQTVFIVVYNSLFRFMHKYICYIPVRFRVNHSNIYWFSRILSLRS